MSIVRLDSTDTAFGDQLKSLTSWQESLDKSVVQTVDKIVDDVICRGDAALIDYCHQLDGLTVASASQLELSKTRLQAALSSVADELRAALIAAADRIRDYHMHQVQESWQYSDAHGTRLGQKITPLDRVGVYVPGGKASYPSSVLMNIVPAKVAGVGEVIMVAPTPNGKINELVLAAAAVAGVDRLFTIGGAQAVAALAYGTETVPSVDKIVGPGNIYVATAKRRVFGQVGIDMIAGPSEVLIIADASCDPDWMAMDMFSQAEHDENAQAILLSPDSEFLDQVAASIERLLGDMSRRDIITASLSRRGALVKTRDIEEALEISNQIAPEHLELALENPQQWLNKVRHAGAIFLGPDTPEAFGDYCAGPNHVLPTSGTARFSSPLGVYDFVKRSSVIMASAEGAKAMAPIASTLAHAESLEAHARSALYRDE